ncbi:MAG: hypothetical protein FWC36_03900 [Spirochaetes bacterium]|nr:hypothetical protein [Spirochaetota bacterium]
MDFEQKIADAVAGPKKKKSVAKEVARAIAKGTLVAGGVFAVTGCDQTKIMIEEPVEVGTWDHKTDQQAEEELARLIRDDWNIGAPGHLAHDKTRARVIAEGIAPSTPEFRVRMREVHLENKAEKIRGKMPNRNVVVEGPLLQTNAGSIALTPQDVDVSIESVNNARFGSNTLKKLGPTQPVGSQSKTEFTIDQRTR